MTTCLVFAVGLIAGLACTAGPAAAADATHTAAAPAALPSGEQNACAAASPGTATCPLITRANSGANSAGGAEATGSIAAGAVQPAVSAPPSGGILPTALLATYGLQGLSSFSIQGEGQTVALVGAGADPTASADLSSYLSETGIQNANCTTSDGCLTIENEDGGSTLPTTTYTGWPANDALGLDIIASLCQGCKILLVEANTTSIADLAVAANTAATRPGVTVVDNPYEGPEFSAETSYDADYDHPGVAMVAAAGDSGYSGTINYPAASPDVVSVGGTVLTENTSTDIWSDASAWSGTVSGCSEYEAAPSWQVNTSCAGRADNDLAAAAAACTSGCSDLSTAIINDAPFDFYNTSDGGAGWSDGGGTAAAADVISAIYALAGTPASGTNPASYPYANSKYDITNITTGSTGTCAIAILCTAGAGWNGPTGWGTPRSTLSLTSSGAVTGPLPGPFGSSCLDDWKDTYANGNKIDLYTCNSSAAQNWTMEANGTITIDSGKYCVGVTGGGTANGTSVVLWTCNGSTNQQWHLANANTDDFLGDPIGSIFMMNQNSGTCLAYPSTTFTAGTQLEIYSCINAPIIPEWNQPYAVPVHTGEIVSQESTTDCIDNHSSKLAAGNTVDIWTCDAGTDSQEWTITANSSIKIGGSYCLDSPNPDDVAELESCDGNGDGTQQWLIYPDGRITNGDGCLYAPKSTNGTQLETGTCTDDDQWTLP